MAMRLMVPNTLTTSSSGTFNITMILTLICKVAYFGIQNQNNTSFQINWIHVIPETTFIYLTEWGESMLKGTYIYQLLSDPQIPHII